MQFAPGTNWSYAHTNFMILGEILSKIGKKPLDTLLREKVLGPMGLKNTTASQTSEIPSPVLHAFDSERRDRAQDPSERPVLRRIIVLEFAMGDAGGREPDNEHRRHGYNRSESRHRCAPVEVQLRSDDWPEPARFRAQAGQLRRPRASPK